jgi:hypothetical protein
MSLLVIFTALILLGINPEPAEATRQLPLQLTGIERDEVPAQISITEPAVGEEPTVTNTSEVPEPSSDAGAGEWHTVEIQSGDNLAGIFSRLGIPPQQLHQILALGGATILTKIYRAGRFDCSQCRNGLVKLNYQIDKLNLLECVVRE